MKFDFKTIFVPSTGVDLVFNLNSPAPGSRQSIIFDADYKIHTVTIAQPFVPVSSTTRFDTLHVTTIVLDKQQHRRVGTACRPARFIDRYSLAGKGVSKALVLQCEPPVFEINIRSAFRLPLGSRHLVRAKLVFQETQYYTAADFKIRDISFAGMGLMIPKKVKAGTNPLSKLKRNDILPMGMVLLDTDKKDPVGAFSVKTVVRRINTDYSETHILAGLKTIQISPDQEMVLNKFIHEAQIAEINRLSALR